MLQLDATRLYDLSEAGRRLYRDPARLAREARLGRIPSARVGAEIGLPEAWVEAESGASPSDPEALCTYWLARLSPPSQDAHRPARDRARLPADDLLEPEEAARRVCASPQALARLQADGTLPSLRVDGSVLYDAVLVDLLAREDEGREVQQAAAARRTEIEDWARFEYETQVQPATVAAESPEEGPAAYAIPTDLDLDAIEPLPAERPPSTLIEAEGFETLDED